MAAGIYRVNVEVGGPLADGTAVAVMKQWAPLVAYRLGEMGGDQLRSWDPARMNKTGRARGNFRSVLHVLHSGPVARIPGPMIEGFTWAPWLEGESKRNQSTRFKGYHLFRKTAAWLRARAKKVGEEELAKLLPKIGGVP